MSDEEWAQRFQARGATGWHVKAGQAQTEVTCGSFTRAAELALEAARVCDEQDHHAEIDVRYPDLLRVTTWSHDVGGLSERDLRLAAALSRLFAGAAEEG
jgi:4a-hydroxytetrahydrobiopterin dehydratase